MCTRHEYLESCKQLMPYLKVRSTTLRESALPTANCHVSVDLSRARIRRLKKENRSIFKRRTRAIPVPSEYLLAPFLQPAGIPQKSVFRFCN